MLVRNWMTVLSVSAIAFVVAIALMLATRVPEISKPYYLSQDEIAGLAATRFMDYNCGIEIELTSKAYKLEQRAIGKVNEEALARAKASLRNTECSELLMRFPDMMTRKSR